VTTLAEARRVVAAAYPGDVLTGSDYETETLWVINHGLLLPPGMVDVGSGDGMTTVSKVTGELAWVSLGGRFFELMDAMRPVRTDP
jgi:hypothetical protein